MVEVETVSSLDMVLNLVVPFAAGCVAMYFLKDWFRTKVLRRG